MDHESRFSENVFRRTLWRAITSFRNNLLSNVARDKFRSNIHLLHSAWRCHGLSAFHFSLSVLVSLLTQPHNTKRTGEGPSQPILYNSYAPNHLHDILRIDNRHTLNYSHHIISLPPLPPCGISSCIRHRFV